MLHKISPYLIYLNLPPHEKTFLNEKTVTLETSNQSFKHLDIRYLITQRITPCQNCGKKFHDN